MADDASEKAATHHLMRVRVRTRIFARLREIAEEQTEQTGEHTSVSDLVRSALSEYIGVYDSIARITDAKPLG
jgi:hypothetical protein